MEHTYAKGLDWLRFSVEQYPDVVWLLTGFPEFSKPEKTDLQPLPYYTHVHSVGCGRIDWNVLRPQQKVLLTMTGADCRRFEERGGNFVRLIEKAHELRHVHFTRIDFAIDVFAQVDIMAVKEAVDTQQASTHFRTTALVESKTAGALTGRTLYLGSRSSDSLVRVYDKAKQAGLPNVEWTRIELECKGRQADKLALAIMEYGIQAGGSAALRRLIVSDVPWFDRAVGGPDGVTILSVGRKETNHERWVRSFLLPQAIKAIENDEADARRILARAIADAESTTG